MKVGCLFWFIPMRGNLTRDHPKSIDTIGRKQSTNVAWDKGKLRDQKELIRLDEARKALKSSERLSCSEILGGWLEQPVLTVGIGNPRLQGGAEGYNVTCIFKERYKIENAG